MISGSIDVIGLQYSSKFFHLFAGKTINDTTFAIMLTNKADDIPIDIFVFGFYLIVQIRTIKRTLKFFCASNSQVLHDICTYFICSRSRQGNNRSTPYFIHDGPYATIFRTEIMSPLRNTMGFIYCIERNFGRLEKIHIFIFCKRLWSHIQKFSFSRHYIFLDFIDG